MKLRWLFALTALFWMSCGSSEGDGEVKITPTQDPILESDTLFQDVEEKDQRVELPAPDYDTTAWAEILEMPDGIHIDLRYATENNFTGKVLYDCPRCFLRPEVAEALRLAQMDLKEKGLGLKVFDCYRPQFVQEKMWEIIPDPNYVANPKSGSMHSRGLAVDVTLTDSLGNELDMGTDFDYFGVEAHSDYLELPTPVLDNRQLLRETMENYGLIGIRTEWWHFSMRGLSYPLDSMRWDCP